MLNSPPYISILLAGCLGSCAAPISQSNVADNGRAASLLKPSIAEQSCKLRLAGQSQEFNVVAQDSSGRQIPLTIFTPKDEGTYPLAAFSHGAFAAPDRYRAILAPIAAAGFVVVAPMHIDSEDFENETPPSRRDTWRTRNLDMALALTPPASVIDELNGRGFKIVPERTVAIGHSYGALIAHLSAGALAIEPDGMPVDRQNPAVGAVVGWSPPGPMAGLIEAEGWSSLGVPTLTITGTKDVIAGFVDDWRAHTTSYDNAPTDLGTLWVGEGVDHYFDGVFGREKPADETSQQLFNQALQLSLEFLERGADVANPCVPAPVIEGETRSSK